MHAGTISSVQAYGPRSVVCYPYRVPVGIDVSLFGNVAVYLAFQYNSMLWEVCLVISFFSISPLFQTDLNRIINALMPHAGNAGETGSFLVKRFIRELFTFTKSDKNQNAHISSQ